MTLLKLIFTFFVKLYSRFTLLLPSFISKRFRSEVALEILPSYKINTKYGDIFFVGMGKISDWRYRTFFKKEPETLNWIDSMTKNDTLWDIGANIGNHSIYFADIIAN